ncbi:MAG: protease [Thermoleophilia bacterium]|nr:protease [Thermoleophilia bacterium]MCZ4496167.1 protease [Thermoleophilia bacterium]
MTVQAQITANRLRTLIVLLGFAVLMGAVVLLVGGLYDPSIAGVVGIGAILYGIVAYFASGRMIASISGAHPITRSEHPELWNAVDNAAIAAGLAKTPDVYIIEDAAPNAFAAGRTPETSYVAATTGLLALLDRRELEGVMAHEIAHVRNRDVRLMTLAAVLTGSLVLLCDILMRMTLFGGGGRRNDSGGSNVIVLIVGIVVVVLAPILAGMLQMSLSRRREYLADASAVDIAGDADGLASALEKLAADPTPLARVTRATAHLYIESPLRDHAGLRSGIGGLFDTHPPMDERIARLRAMGGHTTSDAEPAA